MMKKLLLTIILIGTFFNIRAQNVDLSNYTDYIRVQKNGESGFSRAFGLNAYNHLYIGSVEKTIGDIYFYNSGVNHLMTLKPNGNIGIGTINPLTKLHVYNGNSTAQIHGYADLVIEDDDHTMISLLTHNTKTSYYGFADQDDAYVGGIQYVHSSDRMIFRVNDHLEDMTILNTGSVGIGTTTTGSHKLAVEGSIGAREIKVEASGWSDFVFENDYNLPTLEEVEQHINEKGHLKDIPSAEEVAENGIFLGEMDAKLLQKIEELTLYAIEQEKKLSGQEQKIEALEKENIVLKQMAVKMLELQSRVEKLESE